MLSCLFERMEVNGMDKITKKCHVCGGEMEEGFLLDKNKTMQEPTRWIEGEPRKMMSGVVQFSNLRQFIVEAWRCEECGNLLFTAIKENKGESWTGQR